MGTNCCGNQSSYRCLDLVFNLENGPMGEQFSENCNGIINLMTANGNFDALFFNIGTPNPAGNATNCMAPIGIGNNNVISVAFSGNNMGQIVANLSVTDNMGMVIFSAMEIANPGQAVILTICKPGFGCLEDELVFGCCEADAALSLAPLAPATICAGTSSTLNVKGMNGTPPYTVMLKAATATDTTYFPVTVNDDMDGNTMMDTTLVMVSPTATTTYSIISVEDNNGCAQPVMGQSVVITVNPVPTVDPVAGQTVCNGGQTTAVTFSGSVPGTVYNWTNDNPSIGLAASGTGAIPAFAAVNNGTTPTTALVTVTPVFSNNGVDCPGSPELFTITVNPAPTVNPVSSKTFCNGDQTTAIAFSGAVAGTVYLWTNSNPAIGLDPAGIGDIPAFTAVNNGNTPVSAMITVTPVFSNGGMDCPGAPTSFNITVNPTPTVNQLSDQTVCNGDQTAAVSFTGSVAGTVYNWTNSDPSIGLAASGTGNIAAFTAVNNGNAPVIATITVTPVFTNNNAGCSGTPVLFAITVNPGPTVNPVSDQTVCNGDQTAAVSFSGSAAGTVYNWTNSDPSIGLVASGTGDIAAFTAVNNGNVPVTATITVTPVFSNNNVDCPGAPELFTITVNPTPTVNSVSNQTVCNGDQTAAVSFSGSAAGTVYNWTNSDPSIGLAASGTGNIAAFTAVNNGNAPVTATITVTPVFTNNNVDCPGTPVQFTFTVSPTPTVNSVSDQTVCNGNQTAAVAFTGSVAGTVYNWTNTNPSIGLAASGTGNIPAFTAVNNGNVPATATITVTPKFFLNDVNCFGTPVSFTITVNPSPTVNLVSNQTVCNGEPTDDIIFSGSVAGTVYNWTNSNPSIGLGAAGTGNIASFSAVNNGAVPVTASITVTPVFTNNNVNCPGNPVVFTITVNPTPSVNPVSNQTLCSSDTTTTIVLGGPVAGTVYNWTNSNPSIGLAAAGTGNIPSFTTINGGAAVQTATITVTPSVTLGGVTCTGAPLIFTITVYPRPTVFAGNDQTICQNFNANLAASLGGGATGGIWSGGTGTFANSFSPITTYTPAQAEYGTTIPLVFTSNDPAGPCPAVSDTLLLTINTLPIVNAGNDIMICKNENLDLSKLGATLQANGSGVSTGTWSTNGTGTFQPNNNFPGATTYIPSAADRLKAFVVLTLTSGDPSGPCSAVSDQVNLYFQPGGGLVCNDDVMVALDEDGMVEILPDMILEGTYVDSMFTVEIFYNGVNIGNKVDCSYVGKKLLVRVTDICSGVSCTGSIFVVDNLPPKLVCTDIVLNCVVTNLDPAYLQNVLDIAHAYPEVDENCDPYNLIYSDTWNDLTCNDDYIGFVRRVWTVTDPSGNKATCTQFIYFEHQYISEVLFPADVTLHCSQSPVDTSPYATGAPYLTAYGIDFPLYPDAGFCRLSVAYKDNVLHSCDGTYDIIRTWTVYDWCSPTTPMQPSTNPKYVIQIIKVLDDVGPSVTCPDDRTVSTDPLNCCATTDLPDVIVSDVCSRVRYAVARVEVHHEITGDVIATYDIPGTLTTFPGNNLADPDTMVQFGYTPCLPLGTHTVTYFLEDDCFNTSSCSFQLTVKDLSPPVPACDEITQVALGIDGMIFVNATTFDDGSYDNCSDIRFKARRVETNSCQPIDHFYDQVKFCCEDINDTILVILRVYDVFVPAGPVSLEFEEEHSNECQVQVYVEDKLKPSCIPPANTTVSCENFDPSLWAYGFATGVDNCCIDTVITNTNYQQFDTVCNKGTITRTFRVVDCGGQSSQCTQRVYVNYEQDYYIRFPHDVILTVCDGSANYGEPQIFGEDCELLGISHEDEIFTVVPDACFKIERTWTIINWCTYDPNSPCTYVPNPNPNATLNHPSNLVGPTVSPSGTPAPWAPTIVKVKPDDPSMTDFSKFWSTNTNCYKYKQIIKIIDTQKPQVQCPDSTVQVCDITQNESQLWNEPYWFDNATGSHDLCEAPTDICLTATDLCSGNNISFRYLLFLDLDNNGTMETVISSTNLPDPNTVPYGNAGNPNYAGGTLRAFDERPVPFDQKYRFGLQTTVSGNDVTACVRWNTLAQPDIFTVPELPYGTHKIKWFVEDGCGNEKVCEYTFVVKDCKKPTIVCYNGLSTNMMPTGMVSVDVSLFVEYGYDNCTPDNLLIYAIRESGTGSGFPFNPDGSPQTTVTFDCSELSFQLVEVWAMDLAGNADFCTTYIHVQDNAGVCGAASASVAGMLQTENGLGVEDVDVQIQANVPGGQAPFTLYGASDDQGHFQFPHAIPLSSGAVLTPIKDNDPLNGVSTFDLVLINKHILGLEPLNSPYKMIAADANNSRSITTFDIVELRKLILGVYTEFPENSSWRFVDKSYAFPNPLNPFQEIFPETKSVADVQGDMMTEDFVAVKTGDVNGNAITSSLQFSDDRNAGMLLFDIQDRMIKPGEVFTVDLHTAETVLGFQFTLLFPGLQVLDVQPGAGMSAENFGSFPEDNALTVSVNAGRDPMEETGFAVTFRATSAGLLRQLLSLSSRITKAEAYRQSGQQTAYELLDVGLRFNEAGASTVSSVGFELYQNQPNPWTNKTRVGFHLPEATDATLTVYDEAGRILFERTETCNRGYNAILIDNSLLGVSGLLYYKLETTSDSAVRKMIRMK